MAPPYPSRKQQQPKRSLAPSPASTGYNHVMPAAGLSKCLACDYDLRGLPPSHRCPECGLAYDQDTRVWRPETSLSIISGIVTLGVVLPFLVTIASSNSLHAGLIRLAALCWFVLVVASGLWIRHVHRSRYVVATMPEGLLVRIGDHTLIPWHDLALAALDDTRVRIQRISSNETIDLTSFFKHKLQARSFVDSVTNARERYWQTREKAVRQEHGRRPDREHEESGDLGG